MTLPLPDGDVQHGSWESERSGIQRNFDALALAHGELSQFFFWGTGAPSFTPPGRAVYIRLDGGAGTTLYVYEGASWAAK